MKRRMLFILILLALNVSLLLATPPDWDPVQGTQYSMVVFAEIFLYDDPFTSIDSSNIAAAFGPGGESDCRSLAMWQPDNPPYWDGYWYFTIVGNTNGDEIHFKIYDSITDSIYTCLETISFEDGITIGNAINPFVLTTQPVSANSHNICQLICPVYPNPFTEIITFNFSALHDKIDHLEIYDIRGHLIRKFTHNDFDNSNILSWAGTYLSGISIPAGIYFYKIETESLSTIGKIIYFK